MGRTTIDVSVGGSARVVYISIGLAESFRPSRATVGSIRDDTVLISSIVVEVCCRPAVGGANVEGIIVADGGFHRMTMVFISIVVRVLRSHGMAFMDYVKRAIVDGVQEAHLPITAVVVVQTERAVGETIGVVISLRTGRRRMVNGGGERERHAG